MEDPSPFNWYYLARDSYEEGAYESAISYYNKALELAAIENANNNRSRQRYKEKLYTLRDEVVKTTH
tara:strand:+ start:72 stop:272 length:201 start_codon:yes stop_codon:yes gene_type:complete